MVCDIPALMLIMSIHIMLGFINHSACLPHALFQNLPHQKTKELRAHHWSGIACYWWLNRACKCMRASVTKCDMTFAPHIAAGMKLWLRHKFLLHRELLKEIGPEFKHIIVKFRLKTGHREVHRKLGEGTTRFFNIGWTSESREILRWM